MQKNHFEGKDPLTHVLEKKKSSLSATTEIHGLSIAGDLITLLESFRETLFFLLLFSIPFLIITPPPSLIWIQISFSLALILWKTGKSGWLGWSLLERLHRLIEQERYEIEHHRDQERQELVALYANKGFEGKLLDEIVDHLMADSDRLLKVMIEEEMGLTLEAFDHPLRLAKGAFFGSLLASIIFLLFQFFLTLPLTFVLSVLLICLNGALFAALEKNRVVNAIIWSGAVTLLALGSGYLLLKVLLAL